MTDFNVDITYTINSTEVSDDQIAVTFTLVNSDAPLTTEYTEVYPTAMYFQNIDDTMDVNDLQTQMRSNFLTLAKMSLEAFASEVKSMIKETQGLLVVEDMTGVVSMSYNCILEPGIIPFSIIAKWVNHDNN